MIGNVITAQGKFIGRMKKVSVDSVIYQTHATKARKEFRAKLASYGFSPEYTERQLRDAEDILRLERQYGIA